MLPVKYSVANKDERGREMTQGEYDHVSELDMETIHESLEIFCEDYSPTPGAWECEYSVGHLLLFPFTPPHPILLPLHPASHSTWIKDFKANSSITLIKTQ